MIERWSGHCRSKGAVLVKVEEGDDACMPEQCLEELALKGVAVGRWLR